MVTARAMVLGDFNSPLVELEIAVPDLAAGEALVRITASGVCGSDIHMHRGQDPRTPLPMILGHESVGMVEETSGQVLDFEGRPLSPGDAVAWDRGTYCGECEACERGDEHICPARRAYGIHYGGTEPPPLKGGYATHIVLNSGTRIVRLPSDADHAALVSASCSGATGSHSVDAAELGPGMVALVMGAGPLGLWTAALARETGATVIVIGRRPNRLALAGELGCEAVFDEKATETGARRDEIMRLTGGQGADAVIDTTASLDAAREGLALTRRGGRYVNSGAAIPVGEFPLRLYEDLVLRDITIRGVWVSSTADFIRALEVALEGRYPLDRLVTHRFALSEANAALETASSDRSAIKVVLEPKG